MELQLTSSELKDFNSESTRFIIDDNCKNLAHSYILCYKKQFQNQCDKNFLLIVRSAIFLANKQQFKLSQNEQTKKSLIQVTQILKDQKSGQIEEIVLILKQLINIIPICKEIVLEIKCLISRFSFLYTIYLKYEQTFNKCEWKLNNEQINKDYVRQLKIINWYIFLKAKNFISRSKTDVIESTFIVVALIHEIIIKTVQNVTAYKYHFYYEANDVSSDQFQNQILQCLFEQFSIKDKNAFQIVQNQFQEFLKIGLYQYDSMYNPSSIQQNLKKLETQYQIQLSGDNFDERFFIFEQRQVSFTSSKFTPLTRSASGLQKFLQFKIQKQNPQQNTPQNLIQQQPSISQSFDIPSLQSQRQLKYDINGPKNNMIQQSLNEIKFSKNITTSPYSKKTSQAIQATPMTKAMNQYNWLIDYLKQTNSKDNVNKIVQIISDYHSSPNMQIVDILINSTNAIIQIERGDKDQSTESEQNLRKIRSSQIIQLYFKILEQLLEQDDNQNIINSLNEVQYHKGLILLSFETIYFVLSISHLPFTQLLDHIQLEGFEFWKSLNHFLRYDMNMPESIKLHFQDLEIKIISQISWKQHSTLHQQISNCQQKDSNNYQFKIFICMFLQVSSHVFDLLITIYFSFDCLQLYFQYEFLGKLSEIGSQIEINQESIFFGTSINIAGDYLDIFFRRVLYQCAFQIFHLCSSIQLPEKMNESIWQTVKYILTQQSELMINRHLDHQILSSIYLICKMHQHPIKFQGIINKYIELNPHNKSVSQEIISNVQINHQNNGDIISYYNKIFIMSVKDFIVQKNQSQCNSTNGSFYKQRENNGLLFSPLKQLIPQNIQQNIIGSQQKKNLMTPKSQLIYQFCDSPQIKNELLGGKFQPFKNMKSNKFLNFDDYKENKSKNSSKLVHNTSDDEISTLNISQNESTPQKKILAFKDTTINYNQFAQIKQQLQQQSFNKPTISLLRNNNKNQFQNISNQINSNQSQYLQNNSTSTQNQQLNQRIEMTPPRNQQSKLISNKIHASPHITNKINASPQKLLYNNKLNFDKQFLQ